MLLILAGVAISFTLGENGILKGVETAVDKYQNKAEQEQNELAKIDDYIASNRNLGNITEEQMKSMFYPNKTLNIKEFTDTTQEQQYTIPKSGWLYVSAFKDTTTNWLNMYRNSMPILSLRGGSINSTYIPVNKGDIITKEQGITGFSITVNLYYYE